MKAMFAFTLCQHSAKAMLDAGKYGRPLLRVATHLVSSSREPGILTVIFIERSGKGYERISEFPVGIEPYKNMLLRF
jgi:hypothetical protein